MTLYDSDLSKLNAVLPIEVWDVLLQNIIHHHDLENISNASPIFRELLKNRRTEFLFKQVWWILEPSLYMDTIVTIAKKKHIRCSECGRRRNPGGFTHSSIINLRQTCWTWKTSIDRYYAYKTIWDNDISLWTNRVMSNSLAQQFVNHFAKTHAITKSNTLNPFIGRSITLFQRTGEEIPHVLEMLHIYGNHVFDCSIFKRDNELDIGMIWQLGSWLELMPNLVKLKLLPHFLFDGWTLDDTQLASVIYASAIPTMKHLKRLDVGSVPALLVNDLIKKSKHINTLSIYNIVGFNLVDLDAFDNLELVSFEYGYVHEEGVVFLESTRPSKTIKMLNLAFSNEYIDWKRIFVLLEEKWSSAVNILRLRMPEAIDHKHEMELLASSKTLRLNLPNVTKIKLYIYNIMSLDFLLPLKNSLNYLDIIMCFAIESIEGALLATEIKNSQLVDFLDFQYRLRESNVWVKFPHLKNFAFIWVCIFSDVCIDNYPSWLTENNDVKSWCVRSDYLEFVKSSKQNDIVVEETIEN